MKNINLNFKKIILVMCIFTISIINIPKSHAGVVNIPTEVATLVKNVSSYIEEKSSNISQYLVMAKTLYNTYQSSKALVQQVKNAKLSDYAQNIGSDQILSYGQIALQFAGNLQGEGINVLNTSGGNEKGLGGGQVVTNLRDYLDNVGANELRKALADFDSPENTSPYSTELRNAVKEFSRNLGDTAAGKLVTFTLPYIARNEVCNDPKLKEVIKNGEPADFTKPKPAVGNVDIDRLCNSSAVSIMSAEDQATFTGLAKAGYGGEKTEVALRDPANTASGVISNTLSRVLSKKDSAEQTISRQIESTGLNIGQQTCFDKNGKVVEFDMATSDKSDKFCYSMNSTIEQSGSIVKDRTAAALLSPYFSMLSRAQAITNQTKECADVGGYSGDTGDVVNGVLTDLNQCISAASNIMNTIGTVLNMDGNQLARAVGGQDSPYGALADNIDGIIKSQSDQGGLYAAANDAEKQYQLGYEGYTLDDLKTRVELYSQIRELNTKKLNAQLFTYTILRLGVEKGDSVVSEANSNANNSEAKGNLLGFLGGIGGAIKNKNKMKTQDEIIANLSEAVIGFKEGLISLSRSTRNLIKEMARNNYTEQQMNALLDEFRNTDNSGPENEENQKQIADLLDTALTEKDFANMQLDWSYVPEFEDGYSDPTASESILDGIDNNKERLKEEARQSKALIPPTVEREGPYTEQNTLYLRIRGWKVFVKALSQSTNTTSANSLTLLGLSSTTVDLLGRYGMTTVKSLNPNTPRASAPGVRNITDPENIRTWSELSFCNNLGLINNICDDSNITKLYNDYINGLNNIFTVPDNIDAYCQNPQTTIDQQCAIATGENLTRCQDPVQKSDLVETLRLYCEN